MACRLVEKDFGLYNQRTHHNECLKSVVRRWWKKLRIKEITSAKDGHYAKLIKILFRNVN